MSRQPSIARALRLFAAACAAAAVLGIANPRGAAAQPASPSPSPSPGPAATGSASATAVSPLVDFYSATRQGADAMQTLVLRLRADGVASQRTEYSIAQTAAGTPVTPLFETGTWRDVAGRAVVHFDTIANLIGKIPTGLRHEAIDTTFALSGCSLTPVSDPGHAYGAGLVFTKKNCGN